MLRHRITYTSTYNGSNITCLQYFLPDGKKSKDLKRAREKKKNFHFKKINNLSFRINTLPSLPPHTEVSIPLSEFCDFKRVRKIKNNNKNNGEK